MTLAVGRIALRRPKDPQVRDDQRIHTALIQQLQMGRQVRKLRPAGHGIHRDMHLDVVGMGEAHRPPAVPPG